MHIDLFILHTDPQMVIIHMNLGKKENSHTHEL